MQLSVSCTSRVFLKIPKCLYNSTMHGDDVFYYFYKMLRKVRLRRSRCEKNPVEGYGGGPMPHQGQRGLSK